MQMGEMENNYLFGFLVRGEMGDELMCKVFDPIEFSFKVPYQS